MGYEEGRCTQLYPASGESVFKFELVISRSQNSNLTVVPRLGLFQSLNISSREIPLKRSCVFH